MSLHDDAIVFDGLNISRFDRGVFEDMRLGGMTGANCTCSVWEGFHATVAAIGQWKLWFEAHGDLIQQAFTTDDIRQAKKDGRTAIVLGFQNGAAFEDRLEYVGFFKGQGVGIVQLTYNTQNLIGSGCYESRDSGLSDYGRDVVAEMNRVGIAVDLSHVGPVTSRDAIEASQKPVCYSHCLPSALKEHPRNKSDEELRFMADNGGFIGVTMFPAFLRRGTESTVDDFVEAIDYVIGVVGEDCVGIGTDFTQGFEREFFEYLNHDKGHGRKLVEFGDIINPEGFRTIGEFPNLTAAMERAGWSAERVMKVLGENWLAFLKEVWGT
jgi:membrane dipeptidase